MNLLFLIIWLIHILLVLLTVAFFTLFERKVIALVHLRTGPNKISLVGLIQPLLDAFKLLSKQPLQSLASNKLVYSSAPHLSLFVSLTFWALLPSYSFFLANSFALLIFILLGTVMVFANLIAGWSSNSKYTFIGSLRSVAQSISYESVFTTLVITLMVRISSYGLMSCSFSSGYLIFILLPVWVFSALAETHRAPFDFSERESELVSGYNTEYSGAYFAFVFLGEYSALLFSCSIIYYIFFTIPAFFAPTTPLIYSFITLLLSFFIILVRVTFCRFRYDLLISLAWKSLLPLSLCFLLAAYYLL